MQSVVPPPANYTPKISALNRSEFEVFAHHTSGASGDAHGDKLLEWATNPKFKAARIRYTKMRTMATKAVNLNIPGGVMDRDFTEKADGKQRMIFFFRSLYDAIKQILRNARFAGKQYTEYEMSLTPGMKRKYGAINRGEMYEIAQGIAGPLASPVPVFLSSDTTVICKKMGGHPIICKCQACLYQYIVSRNTVIYICILEYTYIFIQIQAYT